MTKPEINTVTNGHPEYLEYLDNLRESGVTNMFGAGPYLQREFPELSLEKARSVVTHWMETFSERHPA